MTATSRIPLWVFGARGMLAGELLRLLELHPGLELAGAVSRTESDLREAHPHLAIPATERGRLNALVAAGKGSAQDVEFLKSQLNGAAYRAVREEAMAIREALVRLDREALVLTSLHPRLNQPMRLVDSLFFVAEHDDHHISAISNLLRKPVG